MAANEIHVGDIGTVLEITIQDGVTPVDVSGATLLSIVLKKPDGTNSTKTASFTTDGTDGKIQYTIVSGDLDDDGLWQIQALFTIPAGTWYTDLGQFYVYANL